MSSGAPSRGGGLSRGGRGGRGGGFSRGGRGRGGSAPKVRTAGRDATSLEQLFNKNTRYDHRIAKEKKFWDKSKKLRSYHRLLKKEGLEGVSNERPVPPTAQQSASASRSSSSSAAAAASSPSASSAVPGLSVPVSNPDAIFAVSNDTLAQMPTQSTNKQKRKRNKEEGEGAEGGEAGGEAEEPTFPAKKRRLTPEELSALRAQKAAERAARQQQLLEATERRREKFASLTQKTKKGQPNLNNQMEYLLAKLQKQKKDEEEAKAKGGKK